MPDTTTTRPCTGSATMVVLDRDFLVHAAAGTCGGVAGVYVGAPLDTIKVLVQTRSNYSGTSVIVG